MATRDSFDRWIDFLATDPLPEGPDPSRADEELVYVRVRRQELPLAFALPLAEPSDVERLRRRPSRRRNPDWFDPGGDDLTRY